jgi:pyrroloquinoline quinone (PQQ) biosynthesis protein C
MPVPPLGSGAAEGQISIMTSHFMETIERESAALIGAADEHSLLTAVIQGNASREDYVWFLVATYHYLRWSGPLLAETAEGLRRRDRCPWLREVLDAKADEESVHDRWVLADLRALGVNPELVKASSVPRAINAYVEWSMTLAGDGSPAFLGAAYALEFLSMRRAKMAAQNLCARKVIGNVERAVSFLAGHGEADAGHVALMRELMIRIDEPRDQDAVVLSAGMTRALYPRFFPPLARRPVCKTFAA